MITIKEIQLDDKTALRIMKLIKNNEPEIWEIFKPILKQALNKHPVVFSEERAELSCATCKHEEPMPLHICCNCVDYAKHEPAT